MASPIGPLMCDISGLSLTSDDERRIDNPLVGGLILFSRNYQSLSQLAKLTESIRQRRDNILIAVDHEGGRVQRFKEGFTLIPPMGKLGLFFEDDQQAALALTKECGWLLAHELLQFQIDFSFTPVLDIDYQVSQVIGNRSFSRNPDHIIQLAQALITGMHDAGMSATGKHFPGHGFVAEDSHTDIPIDRRALTDIINTDLYPFKALTDNITAGLQAIMPAHIIYSKVDQRPAGFSPVWLKDILRNQLSFEGVIFSDDLSMVGASKLGCMNDRVQAALSAGCDMVLICNQPDCLDDVLAFMETIKIDKSNHLSLMQGDFQQSPPTSSISTRVTETQKQINQLIQRYSS